MVEVRKLNQTYREELNRLALTVRGVQRERIMNMTRDQKYAELNEYFKLGQVFNLDIDQIKRDQIFLNAPDEALDQALFILAALVGKIWQTVPMSPEEVKAHIPQSAFARHLAAHLRKNQGIKNTAGLGQDPDPRFRKGDEPYDLPIGMKLTPDK
jgi:hypothetical protein